MHSYLGLNIQHDANHGAVSEYAVINRVLGVSQNWIGGSALSWIHQHVVQHHMHTNDVNLDPDMAGMSYGSNKGVKIQPFKVHPISA